MLMLSQLCSEKTLASNPVVLRSWGFGGLTSDGVSLVWTPLRLSGAFVYQLGHGPLKAERRVRFPYALPNPANVSFNVAGFYN